MAVRWNLNQKGKTIYESQLKDEPLILRVDKCTEPQFRSNELYIPTEAMGGIFTGTAYSVLVRRRDFRSGNVISYMPLMNGFSENVVHLARFLSGEEEIKRQEQIAIQKFFNIDLEYLIRGIIEFPIGNDFSLRLKDGI